MELLPNILVATPMYDSRCFSEYMMSILHLQKKCQELNWGLNIGINAFNSILPDSRNVLVNAFLSNNFTHLLFIDSDVGFFYQDVIDMVLMDKPFIGGLYQKKNINWEKVESAVNKGVKSSYLKFFASEYNFKVKENTNSSLSGEKTLKEVEAIGTGFMLLKREVFEKLSPLTVSYKTKDPAIFFGTPSSEETKNFFSFDIDKDTKTYISEDFNFCKKWRSLGEKIYVAEWAYARHYGNHEFG